MTGRYKAYPTYKSSTFEWLGDIPKHWDVVYSKWLFSERKVKAQPIDEMLTASQKYGVIPQKMFMELEQQKVVQVQKGHDILKQVKKNDFVISMRSFQGGIEFCDYDGAVSSAYVPLEPRNNGYSTYFKYLFKSKPYIQALQATTNLVRDGQALRFTNFTQVRLPFPTEGEAQFIGAFLDHETAKIDTLIAKQEKLIELLKEKRQAVISHAVTKGLNPDVPMKDSGVEWLGEVPEHWDVIFIKHLSRVKRGASPRPIDDPKYFDDNGEYAWTRIADVSSVGMYLTSTTQRLSTLGSSLSVRLNANELFLSIAGTVGKPCITVSKACIHDGFVYFPELKINNKFLYYIFDAGQAYLGLGKMGTQLNLNTDTVGGIKVGLPPKDEIEQIVTHIENQSRKYSELIDRAVDSIELMKERKTALISAAVTGKIDVRDWQEPTYQESV
ncbi:restriction endonuclease subunit S [Vibrio parahaemolyticus]|nr:restriction endonuclease subunit S [Vibrio parahaemolyticus]EJC7063035.1 restriction endonuclease subunit S [Vibrio parahaemolyticus]